MRGVIFGLATVLVLSACSDNVDQRFEEARKLFDAGEHQQAISAFRAIANDREGDPSILYDVACAELAAGNQSEARKTLGQVLEFGTKPLRARAYANLATIELKELTLAEGEALDGVSMERRKFVLEKAEAAILGFQRARDLDPTLIEAKARFEGAVQWQRVLEDRWATKDREAAREKRRAKKGLDFVKALIEAQRELSGALSEGELLQNLALIERDLREDLSLIPEKAKDTTPAVPTGFAEELTAATNDAGPTLETAEKSLAAMNFESVARDLVHAETALLRIYFLWEKPGDALGILAAREGGLLGVLETAEKAPESFARTQMLTGLRAPAEADRTVLDIVIRRFEAKDDESLGQPLFVETARQALPTVQSAMTERSDIITNDPAKARTTTRAAFKILTMLAEDARLSALDSQQILVQLEAAVRELRRSSLYDDPTKLAGMSGFSVTERMDHLLRRMDYLDTALAAKGQPEEGSTPSEAELEERQKALAQLTALTTDCKTNLQAAKKEWTEGTWPPPTSFGEKLVASRRTLRDLLTSLMPFAESLADVAAEEDRAIAMNDAAGEAVDPKGESLPQEIVASPQGLEDQALEQSLISARIQILSLLLPTQVAALKAKATKPGEAKKALAEEDEALVLVYEKITPWVETAAKEAQEAATALSQPEARTKPTEFRAALAAAYPKQLSARDRLRDALQEIERVKLPLPELAFRLMNIDLAAIPLLREYVAKREVTVEEKSVSLSDMTKSLTEAAAPLVARLAPAVRSALKSAAPAAPEGQAVTEEQKKQHEEMTKVLEAMVTEIQNDTDALTKGAESGEASSIKEAAARRLTTARQLWLGLADEKKMLRQGIDEEATLISRTEALVKPGKETPADRRQGVVADQAVTRALCPTILQKIESAAEGSGTPPPGGSAPPQGSGTSPEVLELAKKNLPRAESLMQNAEKNIGAQNSTEAMPDQIEAKRLLEELLKKLEDEEKKDDEQKPEPKPNPDQSPQSQEQLSKAVKERNDEIQKRREKMRKPTPVEEDW